jgi:hypothetical protein
MIKPQTSSASCRLGIAGLGVALTCNDAALLESLQRRYAGFLNPPEIHLEADVDHDQAAPGKTRPEIVPLFTPGRVSFDQPRFRGKIDLKARRASLSLASPDPIADLDYFLRVLYALLFFQTGGLLFHSAGILRRGKVYLFFGHSGSGKSTVARLSPGDITLNDDLVGLLPAAGSWMVHATPFGDPSARSTGGAGQGLLAALLRLVQDQAVFLERMQSGQALAEVVSNIPVIPADPRMGPAVLARGQALLSAAPAYRLHFRPNPTFWEVIDVLQL